jgi:biopolymer transport protein ExbB
MSTKKTSGGFPLIVSALAIVICLGIGVFIFLTILGAPSNFDGGDPDKGHPHNMLGTMYKGGFIVPILIGFLLTVFCFAIERFITINKASGKGTPISLLLRLNNLFRSMILKVRLQSAIVRKAL